MVASACSWLVSWLMEACTSSPGNDAIWTARVSTCWNEDEYVLEPLNVEIGIRLLVDEDDIDQHRPPHAIPRIPCKKWAEPG